MKRLSVVALTLLLSLSVPVASEEVQADLFADGTGDVQVQSADGSVSQPAPTGAENLDLVGGGVWAEDEASVTFYVEVDDLTEDSQAAPFMDPDYHIYFRYHQQGYRVFVATALQNPVNDFFGRDSAIGFLQREVGPGRYQNIVEAEVALEYDDDVVTATVARDAIVDQNQVPLGRNATLHDVRATASALGFFAFPLPTSPEGGGPMVGSPRFWDAAPDDGVGAPYAMQTGIVNQRGKLVAVSDDPIRWTNGEATTLTFTTRLTNVGSEDLDVRVSTDGADDSWEVAYSDALTVAAGQSVNATLLVTIPFVHQHGLLKLFEARFESGDEHFAATPLGIYWADVPQPAGHHDTVWFHSLRQEVPPPFDTLFSGVHGWFSAKEEVEQDESAPVPAQFAMAPTPFTNNRGLAFWGFHLEPGLRMGLDFNDDEGAAELLLDLPAPIVDGQVRLGLYHETVTQTDQRFGRNTITERVLLASGQSEVMSGTASGSTLFEVPLTATADADLVPYEPDANLYVSIVLDATFLAGGGFFNPEPTAPALDPSGSLMRMPLDEYHDPVDLSFKTDGAIDILVGEAGQERLVNPGRTVVYQLELDYTGTEAATFHAELSGANREWASFLGDQHFTLQPGTKRPLAVAVLAPEDARDGDVSDLSLRVTNVDNAAVQAGVNLRTVVTTTQDIPDEADLGQELQGKLTSRDSPGLPLVLLLGALAVALRRRR